MDRISLLMCALYIPSWGSELIRLEGYLREVHNGAKNEGYALFPVAPMGILLPNGLLEEACFVLVEIPDEFIGAVGKYVVIEGTWKGMDTSVFQHVAVITAEQILDDHWTNTDYESDEAEDFFHEHIGVIAKGACSVARWRSIKLRNTLCEVQDNWLVKIHPDGTVIQLEELPPRMVVKKGAKFILKEFVGDVVENENNDL